MKEYIEAIAYSLLSILLLLSIVPIFVFIIGIFALILVLLVPFIGVSLIIAAITGKIEIEDGQLKTKSK